MTVHALPGGGQMKRERGWTRRGKGALAPEQACTFALDHDLHSATALSNSRLLNRDTEVAFPALCHLRPRGDVRSVTLQRSETMGAILVSNQCSGIVWRQECLLRFSIMHGMPMTKAFFSLLSYGRILQYILDKRRFRSRSELHDLLSLTSLRSI